MSVPEHWSGPYRDDRMYVMRLTTGSTRVDGDRKEAITGLKPQAQGWTETVLLLTYRNVPSLPAVRSDSFDSLEEAIEYVKRVEPTCPRISLDGGSPEPTPSWQAHLEWLQGLGLPSAVDGAQPRPNYSS